MEYRPCAVPASHQYPHPRCQSSLHSLWNPETKFKTLGGLDVLEEIANMVETEATRMWQCGTREDITHVGLTVVCKKAIEVEAPLSVEKSRSALLNITWHRKMWTCASVIQ